MSGSFYVNSKIPDSISFNNAMVDRVYYNDTLVWDRRNRLVKFSSSSSFSMQCYISSYSSASKVWKGTMEYSTDNGATWQVWKQNVSSSNKGTASISAKKNSGEYTLLFRGTGNSYVCGNSSSGGSSAVTWEIDGSNVKMTGNLETLLDYKTVAAGGHPEASGGAFLKMFNNQTALTKASIMLPINLKYNYNFAQMFSGCTKLTKGPEEIEVIQGEHCCYRMFSGCTKLTQAPKLTIEDRQGRYRCVSMFENCTSLTSTPIMIANPAFGQYNYSDSYDRMFAGCTNLRKIQSLWALENWGVSGDVDISTPTDNVQFDMYDGTGILFSSVPTDNCTTLAYTLKDNKVYYTNAEVFYPTT